MFKTQEDKIIFNKKLKNLPIELFSSNYILIASSITPFFYNWGDDVSHILAEFINPNIKVIPSKYSFNIKNKQEILVIGSIITWLTKPNSIIWGSGVQFPKDEILYNGKIIAPKKICSVRGPLTRKYFLDRGIDCPEIYGDPALLFPKYYQPKVEKKYKLGILPHFKDKNSDAIKNILKNNPDAHFIDIQYRKDWRYLIDEIASCEFILSSTLHGIIIADSYNVPNAWVEYDKNNLKRFTFQDYFYSVEKNITEPEKLSTFFNNDYIYIEREREKFMKNWQSPKIDLETLLNACPFKNI